MRRRQFLVWAGLGSMASLAGCSTEDTDSASTDPPSMRNNTRVKLTLQPPQQERSEGDYSTEWTFPSATGAHSVVSPGLQGTEHALRFDGFQKGYLNGALQQGERFAFSFKPTKYSGAPSLIRFQFACSGAGDGNTYRLEFEGSNTSNSDWSLEKYTNGTLTDVDAAGDGVGAALGDEYRVEVDWNTGDTHITARWYNPNGSLRSTPLSITDTEYTQSGVCLMCNANATVLWDEIQ